MYLFGQNMLPFAMLCQNKDISEVLIPGKTNINMNFNRRKHLLELKLCGVRITSGIQAKHSWCPNQLFILHRSLSNILLEKSYNLT